MNEEKLFEEFTKSLEKEDFDKVLHDARRESTRILLEQGIASIALYISQIMVQSLEKSKKLPVKVSW